ncbi:microtubule-associated protein tortifolia1 [Phtheirospermum japonicum]|uniref:Microtubule-associated protein tortifolia1 n=1 Tax=Phtheirospermum japonicum TaxID=374723 RepID=A0A830AZ24_9LAMI|nr:microtubule-associated protein tortifolia1 [Phtheirospermum japonicum]
MKMKTHVNMLKGKTNSRLSNQQVVFELKQRVLLALNKLADRDTHQLGAEDLEKTVECLTPDGIAPFLSCILDTDSEKKSAVRKECIRLMGTLATFHDGLVGPHLGKMVASIVKRLKDSDSVVREACIETVGVLATRLSRSRSETDGLFVVLVRPLFEALGEQNKHVQCGSALCLSQVVDNIHDPPPLVLQKMLARTVKLLKNPHFMAKPAVIELNRSIILAGGTPTHSSLNAALTSIQESLKNSDWATRKSGCAALGDIASCGAACLASFRASCIRCLESCRFDKVKPVRDIALQALQLWRNLPGTNSPEPSEAGSSVKGTSYRDDYGDITSASDATLKDNTLMRFRSNLAEERVPLSSRKAGRAFIEKPQQSGPNDWKVEIAIPKSRNISVAETPNDESDGNSAINRCERINPDAISSSNIGYEYVEVDDKNECSSVSNIFTASIKSKVVTAHCDGSDDASLVKSTGTSRRFAEDEISIEEQRYLAKVHDRRSLDSTITESASRTAFSTSVLDSVSMVQLKVSNLESVVDNMAQELVHGRRYSDVSASKYLKRSPSIVSPRLSTCTPRPSVDSNKQPPLLPNKHAGLWENTVTKNRSNSFGKQNRDMWTNATLKPSKSSLGKGNSTSFGTEIHEDQVRKNGVFSLGPPTKARLNKVETKNNHWKVTKDYLCDGDLDSAYVEALCSSNEIILFDLLDRTGPTLESLSNETASQLLSYLATYLMEQRFLVDIYNIHGPAYVLLSAKAKQDLFNATQEAAKSDVYNPAERKCFTEIGKTLRHFWG